MNQQSIRTIVVIALAGMATACGVGSTPPSPGSISLSLASSSVQLFQAESAQTINATVTRTGITASVMLFVTGLPSGATVQITSPGLSNNGSITIDPGTAAAGTYALQVSATDGTHSASAPLSLVIGAVVKVGNTLNGRLQLAMSTSFQPAEWDYQFFQQNPAATTPLDDLLPQHIRLQPISEGIPQRTAVTWDFSTEDAITQPVLGVADHSPEFQIARAPAFMYDAQGDFLDPTFLQFAGYSQQLVRYYNQGGFVAPDGTHVSPSPYPITFWGIYNEPNFSNLTPTQYTQMYNTVVPAMLAVDPSLKFAAAELGDYPSLAQSFMPTFVANVTAPVDVLATHFYSTCNQKDTDRQLFATVPGFVGEVLTIRTWLSTSAVLANVPVWVTENNVNADYDKGGGISVCNNTTFIPDKRGSSAFFAAWRPYVFAQLGKAGIQALYHWSFPGDVQYGEVDANTAGLRLSYWVDYWLGHMFPSPPGADLLEYTATDIPDVEFLAVQNPDGSVVIMIVNFATASSSDNNGDGAPRTVAIDISSMGSFASASVLTIDATTDVTTGPVAVDVPLASRLVLTLSGYGVKFLKLM